MPPPFHPPAHFPCVERYVLPPTGVAFRETTRLFRLAWAGRRWVAVSCFPFFKGKMLQGLLTLFIACRGKGSPSVGAAWRAGLALARAYAYIKAT